MAQHKIIFACPVGLGNTTANKHLRTLGRKAPAFKWDARECRDVAIPVQALLYSLDWDSADHV